MNIHEIFNGIAFVSNLGIYGYTIWLVCNGERQSFAAWIMWSVLDGITAYSIYKQDGNWILAALCGASALIVSVILLIKRLFLWGSSEWLALSLVLACSVIRYFGTDYVSTIAACLSMGLASIPQMTDSYMNPSRGCRNLYSAYLVCCLLGLFAGKEWSVGERLFPFVGMVGCLIIVILNIRDWRAVK